MSHRAWTACGLLAVLALAAVPADRLSAADKQDEQVASAVDDIRGIMDVVLANHFQPPTRQEMTLHAVRALRKMSTEGKAGDPSLAATVSDMRDDADLRRLLIESCGDFSLEELVEAAAGGISQCVPGGVAVSTAKHYAVDEQLAANRYVGIGIGTTRDEETRALAISHVILGGACDRAGLVAGTLIFKVDGWPTSDGEDLEEIIDRLRGPAGSDVELTVAGPDDDSQRIVRLTRDVVNISSLSIVTSEGDVLITARRLSPSVPHELRTWASSHAAPKHIRLNLQTTEPGSVHNAVLVADEFLETGTIGTASSRGGSQSFEAQPDSLFAGIPMEVSVGPNTRGTSEWLAACLVDNERATAIGSPSAGAALGATAYPLPSGAMIAQLHDVQLLTPQGHRLLGSLEEPEMALLRSVKPMERLAAMGRVVPLNVPSDYQSQMRDLRLRKLQEAQDDPQPPTDMFGQFLELLWGAP